MNSNSLVPSALILLIRFGPIAYYIVLLPPFQSPEIPFFEGSLVLGKYYLWPDELYHCTGYSQALMTLNAVNIVSPVSGPGG